jgi:hypothetical protein
VQQALVDYHNEQVEEIERLRREAGVRTRG